MPGGACRRKFYLSEVGRIEEWHTSNLPKNGYTPEQIEAGYGRLAENFGFYYTLLFMEKVTPYKRAELLEWTVQEFKHNLRFIAWQNHTDEEYAKIMKRKK